MILHPKLTLLSSSSPTLLFSFSSSIPPLLEPPVHNPPSKTHSCFPIASNFPHLRLHATNPSSSASPMIEKETPEAHRPHTFLRHSDETASSSENSDSGSSLRGKFEKMIREAQDSVCAAIEGVENGKKFKEDVWSRPGGGGGISRVLQDGDVWEKAGVNVSVVYGLMPPEAYRAANPTSDNGNLKPGPVPFFAAGISSVLHPHNPFAPTLHFNYRYFETDAPQDVPGAPRSWWFGGGTDLTPSYIFDEDVKHFHLIMPR